MQNDIRNSELFDEIKERLRLVLEGSDDITDKEVFDLIDNILIEYKDKISSIKERLRIRNAVFAFFRRMDLLQELIDDKRITEIMVNGIDKIFVEKEGKVQKLEKCFASREQLENIIQQIVGKVNRSINTLNPIVDARLYDGSRVHIIIEPLSLKGPIITIRKFPEVISMEKLISYNAISLEASLFLEKIVKAGYNIFISGGTNSGKTTFLNALSAYIPKDDRVITIEDSAELQLIHIDNLVSLESRNANVSGEGEVSISKLIKASLRMNPDRIIVGEIRGAEALDMLQAMNTGHDGSLSTGHANSPKDMLSRIETMALSGADLPLNAIRAQIAAAIDIIIHLGRLRDKSRRVLSIIEVGEFENGNIATNTLYEFEEVAENKEKFKGELRKKGELINKRKLLQAGITL